MSADEEEALQLHGFGSSALGDSCPTWLKKFAAMQARKAFQRVSTAVEAGGGVYCMWYLLYTVLFCWRVFSRNGGWSFSGSVRRRHVFAGVCGDPSASACVS